METATRQGRGVRRAWRAAAAVLAALAVSGCPTEEPPAYATATFDSSLEPHELETIGELEEAARSYVAEKRKPVEEWSFLRDAIGDPAEDGEWEHEFFARNERLFSCDWLVERVGAAALVEQRMQGEHERCGRYAIRSLAADDPLRFALLDTMTLDRATFETEAGASIEWNQPGADHGLSQGAWLVLSGDKASYHVQLDGARSLGATAEGLVIDGSPASPLALPLTEADREGLAPMLRRASRVIAAQRSEARRAGNRND